MPRAASLAQLASTALMSALLQFSNPSAPCQPYEIELTSGGAAAESSAAVSAARTDARLKA
eukprot:999753-Prymnesium_polylepis.2